MKALQLHANKVSRSTLLVMAALAVVLLASPASARRAANSNAGESLRVDHDGIYLVQRFSVGNARDRNSSPDAIRTLPYIADPRPIGEAARAITNSAPAPAALVGIAAPSTLPARLSGMLAKPMANHFRPPPHRPVPSQSLPRPWPAGHRSSQALTAGRDGRAGSAARNVAASPGSRRRSPARPSRWGRARPRTP